MAEPEAKRARVERLLEAARRVADAALPEGQKLRRELLQTTGLSAPNIELGLTRCLELTPTSAELDCLLDSTPEASGAHVLLSGNVFVAALRAIAIGVASSPRVFVRPSRRDPALATALHTLAPELFELTASLSPAPGEHVWGYGSDQTLAEVRGALPKGVWFHPHGAGFGAVVIDCREFSANDARDVALDTSLFDRRGCLSPHVVCVQGGDARGVAAALAHELGALEHELPPGPPTPAEQAQSRRARDAATYAFEVFAAGSGWVSCSSELVLPPPGRVLHVVATPDPEACLRPWSERLTSVAARDAGLRERLGLAFPGARVTWLGEMQRPPLDGPVDRRRSPLGEQL